MEDLGGMMGNGGIRFSVLGTGQLLENQGTFSVQIKVLVVFLSGKKLSGVQKCTSRRIDASLW